MTLIDPSDPGRYCSGYALITTPAELALRKDIAGVLSSKIQQISLTAEERERIAEKIRASQAAAFRNDFEVPDVV